MPPPQSSLWCLTTAKKLLTMRVLKVEYKLLVYCMFAAVVSLAVSTTESEYKTALILIALTTIPLLGLSELLAHYAMHPPYCERGLLTKGRSVPGYWGTAVNDPLKDFGIKFKDVSIAGSYGQLSGWLCNPTEAKSGVVVICCHGGGRDRRGWLRHLPLLTSAGHHVLMFDFHGMGKSDGTPFVTYGIREHQDVLSAVQFCRSELKSCKKLVLLGTSVGAAACILAAAKEPAVTAVIAENPIAGPLPFLTHLIETLVLDKFSFSLRWLKFLLAPVAAVLRHLVTSHFKYKFGAECREQLAAGRFDAVDAVKRLPPRPVLLMHGTSDQIVPALHSERIHWRASMQARRHPGAFADLWLAPDTQHCQLFDVHPQEFEERVLGFLSMVATSKNSQNPGTASKSPSVQAS